MGVGMVGGAVKNYFETQGISPFIYDKGKQEGSVEEVNKAEVIFLCVPTPHLPDSGFDLSYIEESCKNLIDGKIIQKRR